MEVCSHNFLDPKTILLKINGTACNMNCLYCSESKKQYKSHMPLDFIESCFKQIPDDVEIILHGGEPLLNSEYIEQVILLHHKFRAGKLGIQSNGCFSAKMLDVLIKHKDKLKLGISLDGNCTQNIFRVDTRGNETFSRVDRLLDCLTYNNLSIKCIATITSANVKTPNELLTYILSKRCITQLRVNPCFDVSNNEMSQYAITPTQFYDFLEKITVQWIETKGFLHLRLDPIQAALENKQPKSKCSKCWQFVSLYPNGICTLCDALGDKSFHCNDITTVFVEAKHFFENQHDIRYCSTCQHNKNCEEGCIAILNRLSNNPLLIEQYCQYKKKIFALINNLRGVR